MVPFLSHFSSIVAALAYAVGSLLYIRLLSPNTRVRSIYARWALFVGVICHATFLFITDRHTMEVAKLPYLLSLISVIVVGLFVLLERRYAISGLGAFVAPLSLLFMVFSAFLFHVNQGGAPLSERGMLLTIHYLCATLAYVMFVFAFAVSLALIFQESLLKRKRFPRLQEKLPSLVFLDRFHRWLLLLGFILLNVGVGFGIIFALVADLAASVYQQQILWVAPAMMVYGLLVTAVFFKGLRGRRAAWLSVVGFVTVILSFFGSGISSGTFHVY